ncbi:DUF6624 domain-containing protein [Gluconacetobacter sp. Hr-1-5]|uniref:DUF6624 domain-containing protein n=1 Tax=Gluconacetobacter sp. Hr-1-5 TaxID=3395370 RepID=UPI003B52E11C
MPVSIALPFVAPGQFQGAHEMVFNGAPNYAAIDCLHGSSKMDAMLKSKNESSGVGKYFLRICKVISFFILCSILHQSEAFAEQTDPLLLKSENTVRPIFSAIARVMISQRIHQPPLTLADRLIQMGQIDAVGRDLMEKTDLTRLPEPYRQAASDAVWHEINLHDLENQKALRSLLPAKGWFDRTKLGDAAATSAFMVVQHAVNNPSFMEEMLSRMQPLAGTPALDGHAYGLLVDRVRLQKHQPQIYGTQYVCVAHHWTMYTLLDASHADQRRKAIGFKSTVEDDARAIASNPPCYPPKN